MIDKEKYLRAKLKDFQHIFEQTEDIYEHPPDRGDPREKAVRDYLKFHLPKKYGVTSGKILNPNGMLSRQIDVIIYDALNCPILFSERIGGEYQIIPADSTVGAIEVKSIVTPDVGLDILKNIESFMEAVGEENNKVIAGFFGYSTPIFKTEDEVSAYLSKMQKIFSNEKYKKILRVGCILPNKQVKVTGKIIKTTPCFYFMRGPVILDSTITKGKERKIHNYPTFAESDPEVILSAFMLFLSEAMNKWRPRKYSMMKYYLQFGKVK